MRDNELIRIFLPIIKNGLTAVGFSNVTVKQSNQPTQQGINTDPTLYFYKVGDRRYGYVRRYSEWVVNRMVHTEIQFYETRFQISALVLQNPKNPNQYTASDWLNEVAAILQSDNTAQLLFNRDVGILRIMDIVNPYFVDDRDNFEASPSFDFMLTHSQTRVTADPVIDSYTYNIKRV